MLEITQSPYLESLFSLVAKKDQKKPGALNPKQDVGLSLEKPLFNIK
ncbi:MAG: hypothetical protein R6W85_01070 [Gillisia sp.]